MLGKIEGRRRRGQQRMRWLDGFEQTPVDSEGWGRLACCSPWAHKEFALVPTTSTRVSTDTTLSVNNTLKYVNVELI